MVVLAINYAMGEKRNKKNSKFIICLTLSKDQNNTLFSFILLWYLPRFCGRMAHLFFVCVQRKLARSNHYLSAKILLTLQLCFNMIWIHTYVLWLHALKMKLSMASISPPSFPMAYAYTDLNLGTYAPFRSDRRKKSRLRVVQN